MKHLPIVLIACVALTTAGCQSAYYKTMEMFGRHKRDLLVENVEAARNDQEQAKEQFASALDRFLEVVDWQGGELEAAYRALNDELQDSERAADAVWHEIEDVEDVAADLFAEWEAELDEYTSRDLRRASERALRRTRSEYQQMITAMRQAADRMDPVLDAFGDHVLFLKHNLNARAVASLEGAAVALRGDVARLIEQMEQSIAEANRFIEQMETADGG